MLYSRLFGKTQKTVSVQFESTNHELLTKAGFIDQVASGIFDLLPLGKRALTKIETIIREEMNNIGAQEVQMPLLIPKKYWQTTNRWDVDVIFKTESRYNQKYGLSFSHEETVTPLAKKYIRGYRDLPLSLYHITEKFRDEPRPKSGILRGREFGMKDLYSFHETEKDLNDYYKVVIDAYLKVFMRCGFSDVKITEASGGTFTKKHSLEFNVITKAGEVDLIYCNLCSFAQNEEIAQVKIGDSCPKCKKGLLKKDRAIEIGNIFDIGTRFSEAFDIKFTDKNSQEHFPFMGCYGIGTSRVLGASVEVHHDDRGIIWPDNIAPYQIHLIGLDLRDENIKKRAFDVYQLLTTNYKLEVLFDDREDISAGAKFADADLIGIPTRLVVSKRTGEKVEYKRRSENKTEILSIDELLNVIARNAVTKPIVPRDSREIPVKLDQL